MKRIAMRETYARLAFSACLVACFGDMLAVYIFGALYPGYNHITQPMSVLGGPGSPVARPVSAWWVFIGVLFILFAAGYRRVYTSAGRPYRIVSWLIAAYGAGEGIGSGLFPVSRVGGRLTPIGIVHDSLGVLGVLALMALPFILMRVFSRENNSGMRRFSLVVAVSGIMTVLLFNLSKVIPATNTVFSYQGFWQRVFVFIYYGYLLVIAYRMLQFSRKKKDRTSNSGAI
jgi:hypothetical protein